MFHKLVVSAGAALLPADAGRVRCESGLRVRQGGDPARQHRHGHRQRVAQRSRRSAARARGDPRRPAGSRALRELRRADRASGSASSTNDRSWFPAQRCRRDDALGEWPCKALAASPPKEPQPPSEGTTFPRQGEKHVQAISPSLVLVNFDMPYTVSGRRGPLLLRHGHHRRRRARLGRRRPQYGARRDGRRAARRSRARSRSRGASSTSTRCTILRWCRTTRR